ncbi:MAG: hypothetical protein PHX18_08695 [Candidatus Gastranaerophilales bacterium]|nr:hypothetical protein [Candidatus Gastranaerophilales bacterium]
MEVKLNVLKRISLAFGGAREDHNSVKQLKNNNDYALTYNNQRRISTAINNLSNDSSPENVQFLMDVAANLRYAARVDLAKKPNNDWKQQLQEAARQALDNMDNPMKADLEKRFEGVFLRKKAPVKVELELLGLKKQILEATSIKHALKRPADKNIANIPQNLDYFIISSEISLEEKKKVLEKLNFFLGKDYKITPQLKNKKVQVLSEILNDIVIRTPESSIPNIKQVDQREHGMCAAISICRKALAYEDKSKYVDIILNELDNTPHLMVYNISDLKSGQKIPIAKTHIDFDYAQQKDYRIIDASALQWMNAAGTVGRGRRIAHKFVAFDKDNFDLFHDSFFLKDFEDLNLAQEHYYLRTLVKAKSAITDAKITAIKNGMESRNSTNSGNASQQDIQILSNLIDETLSSFIPGKSFNELRFVSKGLIGLLKKDAKTIMLEEARGDKINSRYKYIDNEEESVKIAKMSAFLEDTCGIAVTPKLKERIFRLISSYQEAVKLIPHGSHKTSNTRQYRELFEAEVAYKAFFAEKLSDMGITDRYILEGNYPDDESRLTAHLENLVKELNGEKGDDLAKILADKWKMKASKEGIINEVSGAASDIQLIMENSLDEIYSRMLLQNKRYALGRIADALMDNVKQDKIINFRSFALKLGVKSSKEAVLQKLSDIKSELEGQVSETRYREIMKNLGYASQIKLLVNMFNSMGNQLMQLPPDSEEAKYLAIVNGVGLDDANALAKAVNVLAADINDLSERINNIEEDSSVIDPSRDLFLTSQAELLLLRKFENKGEILSDKQLIRLHDKFLAISAFREKAEKAWAENKVKLKMPEELRFTPYEQSLFKQINSNLNKMYHVVLREYQRQNKFLEKPLSELVTKVGKETGHFWVGEEGQSGLYTPQEIRIFEQMTGREYYAEKDLKKLSESIKKGPHSGVSSTSVYHNERAGHAQYIADVAPITVVDKKTGITEVKDAIMHDNTWGKLEHLNTWVDSEGLMRTDYGSGRGGKSGYITDAQSKNGVFVEDFLENPGQTKEKNIENRVYKKLKPPSEEFKFKLFSDGIIAGRDNSVRDFTSELVQTIFVDYFVHNNELRELNNLARKMTPEQLEAAFLQNDQIERTYKMKKERLMKIVENKDFLHPMRSVEDYNKLNDFELKLTLRKMAVADSYYSPVIADKVNRATTFEQLEELKRKIPNIAKEDFKYVFGKTKEYVSYVKLETSDAVKYQLKTIGKKYNIKFSDYNPEKSYDASQGSMSKFIELTVRRLTNSVSKQIASRDDAQQIKHEIKTRLTNVLANHILFQPEDLDKDELGALGFNKIKRWIDKTYNPRTNEEFVSVYRNLQNMTNAEFEEILAGISNEDLGIKHRTEFSYIHDIQNADDDKEELLLNRIYSDVVYSGIKKAEKLPEYSYQKFAKKHTFNMYKGKRNFVEMYRDMDKLFQNLGIEKFVKQYRGSNFQKYGARPAFPKTELLSKERINDVFDDNISIIGNDIAQLKEMRQQYNHYKLLDELNITIRNNDYDLFINTVKQFKTRISRDEGLDDVKKAVDYILSNKELSGSVDFFAPQYRLISQKINEYRSITSDTDLEGVMNNALEHKAKMTASLVELFIHPKYRNKIYETFKQYTSALIQEKPEAQKLYETLKNQFYEYNIMHEPKELLKEYFRITNSEKYKKREVFVKQYTDHVQHAISAALRSELEFLLIHAASEGFVHKIKDELMTHSIPEGIPNAGLKLSSDDAIRMMIESISYQTEDNSTLMLFLNQTGLSERALNIGIKDIDLIGYKKQINEFYNHISDILQSFKILKAELKSMERAILNPDNDIEQIFRDLYSNIDRSLKAKKSDTAEYIKMQKDSMDAIKSDAKMTANRAVLFREINNRLAYDTAAYKRYKAEAVDEEIRAMNNFIEYIGNFEFPNNSEPAKKRDAFIKKANQLMEYQNNLMQKLVLLGEAFENI